MKTMLDYINEIPEYISKHEHGDFELLRNAYLKEKKNIVIIASGSSNNASMIASYYLKKKLQCHLDIETPYTFYNYEKVDPDSFYIVISQSGRSINTLKVIEKLKQEKICVHFITDNKEIQEEDFLKIYHLDVGNEEVPFVTLGMSSTIYFLMKFACSEFIDISLFQTLLKEYQKKAIAYFEEKKDLLLNIKRVHILGGGPCMYVAREGALKFCETLQVGATGYEIEEYLHGGNFETCKEHLVIAIDSNECDKERIENLKKYLSILCDNVVVIERVKEVKEDFAVFFYLAYFQTLVYQINVAKGNLVPTMKQEYLKFESLMKAKTINYYE